MWSLPIEQSDKGSLSLYYSGMLRGVFGSSVARFAASVVAMSVSACSGDDPAPFDCTVLPVCDIAAAGCQDMVFRATVCAREQDGASLPSVRSISRQELEAELRRDLAEDPERIPAAWETTYQLLGLIPNQPLGDVLVENAVSSIAAYYRNDTKQVTVIRDNSVDRETGAWILSHEFVHALQDQAVDLGAFQRQWTGSTDHSMALDALIEGEAMVHPNILQARRVGRSPESVDWNGYASRLLASAFESVEGAPSPFVDALSTLPYPIGFRFLIDPWLANGQTAIDELFAQPQFPFVNWLFASTTQRPEPVAALTCFPTGAPPGFTAFDHDSLGPTALFGLFVGFGTPGEVALRQSTDLHDDSLVVFTNAQDPVREGVAVAWRLRFQDFSEAATVFNTLGLSVPGGTFSVTRFNRELLILAAGDPAVLDAWTNAADCGRAEDLPVRSATSQSMSALVRRTLRGRR